jgi:hypothetical protein
LVRRNGWLPVKMRARVRRMDSITGCLV